MKFALLNDKPGHIFSGFFHDNELIKVYGKVIDEPAFDSISGTIRSISNTGFSSGTCYLAEKHLSKASVPSANIYHFIDNESKWESYTGTELEDYVDISSAYLWIDSKDLEFLQITNKEAKTVLQSSDD